jgi:ATP-binding cassette subfamily B protein
LLRFSDVEGGEILIGGHRIDSISQADLRSDIAYVPQDPQCFTGPSPTTFELAGRMRSMPRCGRLHGSHMPRSSSRHFRPAYDTLVGERGIKRSVGSVSAWPSPAQSVKNAPIRFSMKRTSSLDSESEGMIQDALWTLMRDERPL